MNKLTDCLRYWFSKFNFILIVFSLIFSLFYSSCNPDKKDSGFTLRIRLKEDVDCLHPIVSQSSSATQIEPLIMLPMIEYSMDKIELTPLLVLDIPRVTETNDTMTTFESDIRPEAVWDDGSPITASDYAFTVKAALNPFIKNPTWKGFLKNIVAIKLNPSQPKHLIIQIKKNYILGAEIAGNINLYPEAVYDPEKIMNKYQVADLITKDSSSWSPQELLELQKFADAFQTAEMCKSKIAGSGPYRLESWDASSKIVLQKKSNWWGTKIAESISMLQSYPDRIEYLIMPDETATILALKEGSIDLATEISPKQFNALQSDNTNQNKLQFFTPGVFQYTYLELNTSKTSLSEPAIRNALARLIDIPGFIKNIMHGLADPIVGPIHPSRIYYNQRLKPISLNSDSAKAILQNAGWSDSNKDGILDKKINNKLITLSFKLLVSSETGKKLALLLQEEAKKVGIEIKPETKEFALILKDLNERNFEIAVLTGKQSPSLFDPYQSWHSSNAKPGGSNRCGFATSETDSLIQIIRTTKNEEERNLAYLQFQEILYIQQPQIFLFSPKERLIATKRIQLEASSRRPGYLENTIRLAK
ncbi:MAG: hypothetical protein IPO86_03305 [Saprospiraceae bacterium]|nr:hypothetical protein [Saprospiraceae bacterium]